MFGLGVIFIIVGFIFGLLNKVSHIAESTTNQMKWMLLSIPVKIGKWFFYILGILFIVKGLFK